MRTSLSILCFSALFCLPSLDGKRELPEFLKLCHRTDPNLGDCVKASILALQPYLGKGIPEMKIPPFDPLIVTQLEIRNSGTEFNFKNLEFSRLDQFTLGKVTMNLKDCYASMEVFHPLIPLKGTYSVLGKLLAFDLRGGGLFESNNTKVQMLAEMNCKRKMRRGKEYLKFDKLDFNVYIDQMDFLLHDLFQNNRELTDTVNRVLNENGKSLAEDFQPLISQAIREVVRNTIQAVFDTYPEDVLIPK